MQWIEESFAKEDITAWPVITGRGDYGSPLDGWRAWFVVFAFALAVMQEYKAFFLDLSRSMRLGERLPLSRCLMDDDLLEELTYGGAHRDVKKTKQDSGWKDQHEAFAQLRGLAWPADTSVMIGLADFRGREAEFCVLANQLFPATPACNAQEERIDSFDCFDCNHTLQCVFRWPVKKDGAALPNPWRRSLSFMTSQSVIVVRCLKCDGTLKMRRLHCLEAFRAQGWDLDFWLDADQTPVFKHRFAYLDFLMARAANMWNF